MSEKLPVISGKDLIKCLTSIGYSVTRQRGSHVRLEKETDAGTHKITVPNHNPIARGTLDDILNKVSIWNQITKEKLIRLIRDRI